VHVKQLHRLVGVDLEHSSELRDLRHPKRRDSTKKAHPQVSASTDERRAAAWWAERRGACRGWVRGVPSKETDDTSALRQK
jgi:hypothetical protein